jgi:hypothetical protein
MLWFCMAQSNEEEPSAHPGRSVSIERHDARDVDLELADHLAPGQEPDDAAAAVKAAVKEAAEGKAAGAFEFEVPDLVDTPGSLQMISTLWILFLQKLSLQWHVGVEWPSWFLNFLDVLAVLCFKMPALGIEVALLEIPEDCVFVARLLLPVALLARMWWMMITTGTDDEMGAPHYGSFAWAVGTVALAVAAPTLLSVLAIWIGASNGANWLTGLGVVLCWPIIGYLVLAHVARVLIWKSCLSKCVH